MDTKDTFSCTKCGECCRPIVKVSKEEVSRIKEAGVKDFIVYDEKIESYVLKQVNNRCMFLKKEGEEYVCSIYDYRPSVCRQYPFIGRSTVEDCRPKGWERWEKIEELF